MRRTYARTPKPLAEVAAIGAWTEAIDADAVAGVAVLRLVDRGGVYGAGTMLLVPVGGAPWAARRSAREGAVRKLLAEISAGAHYQPGRAHHQRYYYLPLVERVRDLNRA